MVGQSLGKESAPVTWVHLSSVVIGAKDFWAAALLLLGANRSLWATWLRPFANIFSGPDYASSPALFRAHSSGPSSWARCTRVRRLSVPRALDRARRGYVDPGEVGVGLPAGGPQYNPTRRCAASGPGSFGVPAFFVPGGFEWDRRPVESTRTPGLGRGFSPPPWPFFILYPGPLPGWALKGASGAIGATGYVGSMIPTGRFFFWEREG